MQLKAAVIEDMSCFGKCSAAVALPILACCKIEAALLPTALLSAHTAFEHYTMLDLTEQMRRTMDDWQRLGLSFDGICTGYMINEAQLELSAEFIKKFAKPGAVVVVDPVIGDDGKPYTFLTDSLAGGLRRLCSMAQIITPNLTEAALLLGESVQLEGYDSEYIIGLLKKLGRLGCQTPIITGVTLERGKIGAAYLDGGCLRIIGTKKHEGVTCGTGDVFTSAMFARLLCGDGIDGAVSRAVTMVEKAIRHTDVKYAIEFESALDVLK